MLRRSVECQGTYVTQPNQFDFHYCARLNNKRYRCSDTILYFASGLLLQQRKVPTILDPTDRSNRIFTDLTN
jgi:hypothetical protein